MERAALSKNADVCPAIEISPDVSRKKMSADFDAYAKDEGNGEWSLVLMVDNVTCAACIQKIESALFRERDVVSARLNFSTRRLSVRWRGNKARGNDLAKIVMAQGYRVQPFDPEAAGQDALDAERFFLLCLGVAGFAAGNIMLLSVGLWTTTAETMGTGTRDLLHWISAFIALPAILFSGRPFFRSAWGALKSWRTNMDVPISLALILTCAMSLFEVLNHGEHAYFDSVVMLMFFLLIGRYLDLRARRSARSTATDLLSMMSGTARVARNDGTQDTILIRDLSEGMTVLLSTGERVPADGVILKGQTDIDTGLVTGETVPVQAGEGDRVYAGTINISAPVRVKVQKASEDSLLSEIVTLMEKAEQGQSRYVRLADRAARLYAPLVHSLAFLSFVLWWGIWGLSWQPALMIAVTVLIITCPCALGLAVPVVQVLATGRLLRNGVLLKSGDALERLATVDTVVLDKTGTLTMGVPVLENRAEIAPEQMRLAASMACTSTHPLSRALCAAYDGPLLELDVRELPGQGLEAVYDGNRVRLGSRNWCGDQDAANQGGTELWLASEGENPCQFTFSDTLRADAKAVIDACKSRNLSVLLLSGDRQDIVKKTAQSLGIDDFWAEMTPGNKFEKVEALKQSGHRVLMVGDGLNDAPVLTSADVSMSPSTAIDMAQNASDIVFMGTNLSPVVETYDIARRTQKLVKQNFGFAVLYNVIAVPLAVAGFVTPFIAAAAMSASSLVVVANSFRLGGRFRKKGGA